MARRVGLLMLMALSSGCGETLSPGKLVGTYRLTAINQQSPPRMISATSECDRFLVGGHLDLLPVPDWSVLTLNREQDCARAGGGILADSVRSLGRYWVREGVLTFQTQHSLEDTLRFSGLVRRDRVNLEVNDVVLDPAGPFMLRFDRVESP